MICSPLRCLSPSFTLSTHSHFSCPSVTRSWGEENAAESLAALGRGAAQARVDFASFMRRNSVGTPNIFLPGTFWTVCASVALSLRDICKSCHRNQPFGFCLDFGEAIVSSHLFGLTVGQRQLQDLILSPSETDGRFRRTRRSLRSSTKVKVCKLHLRARNIGSAAQPQPTRLSTHKGLGTWNWA